MKGLIILLGASSLACLAGCAEEISPARLVFDADAVDLGVLDPGESDFVVPYRNGGKAPLRLDKVSSTCSCTNAEATPEVGPGAAGAVKGKVRVQSGPGGAVLTLTATGAGEPRKLSLKWFGKSTPTLLPTELDVRMKAGARGSYQVEISYPAGDPPTSLQFVGVEGLPEGGRAELIRNNPAAIKGTPGLSTSLHCATSPFIGEARVRIDLTASPTTGAADYPCLIRFRQQSKAIDLPFHLRIRIDEGLRCSPESLLFSASDFEALKRIRRKVILTSDVPGDRFEVVEKPDFLAVRIEDSPADRPTRAFLTAEVASPPPSGDADRRLVLRNSAGRRMEIPLFLGLQK